MSRSGHFGTFRDISGHFGTFRDISGHFRLVKEPSKYSSFLSKWCFGGHFPPFLPVLPVCVCRRQSAKALRPLPPAIAGAGGMYSIVCSCSGWPQSVCVSDIGSLRMGILKICTKEISLFLGDLPMSCHWNKVSLLSHALSTQNTTDDRSHYVLHILRTGFIYLLICLF